MKNQPQSSGEHTLTEEKPRDPFDFSQIPPMFMSDNETPRYEHGDPDKACLCSMFDGDDSLYGPGDSCIMCGKQPRQDPRMQPPGFDQW